MSHVPVLAAAAGIAALAGILPAGSRSAEVAFPGRNGLITLAFRAGESTPTRFASMTPGGKMRTVAHIGAWSPDGSEIVFGGDAVSIADPSGSHVRRLTRANGDYEAPAWSPDGSRIAFERRSATDDASVFVMRSDGSHVRGLAEGGEPAWSPDGKTLAFSAGDATEVWLIESDGSHRRRLVSLGRAAAGLGVGPRQVYNLSHPAWSPDGRALAFASYYYRDPWEDLQAVLTVGARVPSPVGLVLNDVRPTDELSIDWSPDGRSLLLGTGPGHVIEQPVAGDAPVDLTPTVAWSSDATWQPLCLTYGSGRGDALRGSAVADILCGLGGNDTITGGPGRDRLFGEEGNDTIDSRDGAFDVVGCGPGIDTVRADRLDLVGADCERVTRT